MAKKMNAPETKPEAKKSNDPFKTVSENLPFYPDTKAEERGEEYDPIFIGCHIGESVLGENVDPSKNTPVYIFAKIETGEKFYVSHSHAITKAIEKAIVEHKVLDNVVFRFDFKGKSESNGKPFNMFNTGYCTIEEYEASKEAEREN